MYFRRAPSAALLCDSNKELINAYKQLRDNITGLLDILSVYDNSKSTYYLVRGSSPTSDIERAARLFYLTRLSFNGIYRENLKGMFNVPYGYKSHLSSHDAANLKAASAMLQSATLIAQDFRPSVQGAAEGDLVYVDPPYTVAHNNNGFIKYNQTLFSWSDQCALALECSAARLRGAHVLVSNADHEEVKKLYPDFNYFQLHRFSSISGKTKGRRNITEALLVGKPL